MRYQAATGIKFGFMIMDTNSFSSEALLKILEIWRITLESLLYERFVPLKGTYCISISNDCLVVIASLPNRENHYFHVFVHDKDPVAIADEILRHCLAPDKCLRVGNGYLRIGDLFTIL